MPSVFLSHSWADKDFVRRLAADLEAESVRVWLDEAEIKVGDSLIEKIRAGIDQMDFLIAVLSPDSVASPWVARELDIAMNQEIEGRRVKVLPLLLRTCEMPGFLMGKKYANFQGHRYGEPLSEVLEAIGIRPRPSHLRGREGGRRSARQRDAKSTDAVSSGDYDDGWAWEEPDWNRSAADDPGELGGTDEDELTDY